MKYTECANGHVYDSDQYAVCPYCNNVRTEIQFGPSDGGKTVAPSGYGVPDQGRTVSPGMGGGPAPVGGNPYSGVNGERIMPVSPAEDARKTVAPDAYRKRDEQSNKTVAVFKQRYGLDPVVGWLVCIEGPDKGTDFRLFARINSIGRGEGNDVCVKGDRTISSHAHAKIAYDARHNNYQLLPGEGANINYLNDQPVYTPVPLQAYDLVDLGESRFLFIPLCGERFQWAEEGKARE